MSTSDWQRGCRCVGNAPSITSLQALLAQLEVASDHVYQLCLPLDCGTAGLQLQRTLVLTISLIKLTHAQICFACSQSIVMLLLLTASKLYVGPITKPGQLQCQAKIWKSRKVSKCAVLARVASNLCMS